MLPMASHVVQLIKNPPAMRETPVQFLGGEDPLGEDTPVFWPGESPWTEESGGLQSMGSHRVRYLVILILKEVYIV